jgi:hypothetical protein
MKTYAFPTGDEQQNSLTIRFSSASEGFIGADKAHLPASTESIPTERERVSYCGFSEKVNGKSI